LKRNLKTRQQPQTTNYKLQTFSKRGSNNKQQTTNNKQQSVCGLWFMVCSSLIFRFPHKFLAA
jgi:hypothetical protein